MVLDVPLCVVGAILSEKKGSSWVWAMMRTDEGDVVRKNSKEGRNLFLFLGTLSRFYFDVSLAHEN